MNLIPFFFLPSLMIQSSLINSQQEKQYQEQQYQELQQQQQQPEVFNDIKKELEKTFPSFKMPFFAPESNPNLGNIRESIHENIQKYKTLYKRNPPPNYDRWIIYCLQNGVTIDPSHYRQINEDFIPFRDPLDPEKVTITQELIKKTLNNPRVFLLSNTGVSGGDNGIPPSYLEVIKVGKYILPKKYNILFKTLDEPLSLPVDSLNIYDDNYLIETNNNDLITSSDEMFKRSKCMRDNFGENREKHSFLLHGSNVNIIPKSVPLLGNCKLSKCFHDIIVPIFELRMSEMVNVNAVTPWNERISSAVFKGSTTGITFDERLSYRANSRVSLMDWSKRTRHENEISFTKYQCQPTNQYCKSFMEKYPLSKRLSYKQQQKYKYNVVVDGCSWAARLPNIISNGFLTFYNSIWISWSNAILRPFEHYIPLPITDNYESLEKSLDYFKENDEKAKKIAMDGMAFSQTMMRKEDKVAYTLLVLLEYASITEGTEY